MALPLRTARRLRDIRGELRRIDTRRPSALPWFVRELVDLVGADGAFALRLTQWRSRLCVEELIGDRVPVEGLRRSFDDLFGEMPIGWTDWNHLRPEPSQRNRPISAVKMLGWAAIERVPAYQRVLVPNGLARMDNLRVLACHGPALLAWVGAVRSEPFTARELATYDALVPALRTRLVLERQIDTIGLATSDMAAALEALAVPAFILGADCDVVHANAAGCARLAEGRRELLEELRHALAGAHEVFTVSRIGSPGVRELFLAVQRRPTERTRAGLRAMKRGGSLSKVESEILELLVRGVPDETIAVTLGSPREAIEAHVRKLMTRFDCDSRATLVQRVVTRP